MNRPAGQPTDREKLFRRMEWVYIYLPPVLIVAFAALGGAILAALIDIDGTTYRGRWAIGSLALIVTPTIAYLLREAIRKKQPPR